MAPCCLIHTQHRYNDFRDVPDPYEVLQVKPTASQAEIRSAYYAQCKLFHPDRLHTNCPATSGAGVQAFQRLSAAYALLNDPATRRRYDDYRASHLGTWFRSRDSSIHPASDLDPPFDFHRARDIFHTQRASSPRRASYTSSPTSTSDRPGAGAGDPHWNPSYWHLSNHVWQPARRWRLSCYARWCLTSYVVVATVSIIGFASFCDPGN